MSSLVFDFLPPAVDFPALERVSTLTDVGDNVITMLLSMAQFPHCFAMGLPDPRGHTLRFALAGVVESESVKVVLHLYIRHYGGLGVYTFLGFFKSFFAP